MKVKGVHRDSSKFGELIEMSAEEKVPKTLQNALSNHNEFTGRFSAWARDITLTGVNFFPKGKLLKDKWQNNQYKATGTFSLHVRKLDPDRLLAPKKKKFSLEFEDCLDPIGLPDTKVVKLTLE